MKIDKQDIIYLALSVIYMTLVLTYFDVSEGITELENKTEEMGYETRLQGCYQGCYYVTEMDLLNGTFEPDFNAQITNKCYTYCQSNYN